MDLKILIRQEKMFDRFGQERYWQGTNPSNLSAIPGEIPIGDPRRFPNYPAFIDVTDQVSDLHKLTLSWSDQRDNEGQISGEGTIKKGVSGTLTFEGEAYRLVKKWLVDDVSASLNAIDVQILHVGCGTYSGYSIKHADLAWCEGDICSFDLTMKQQDERISCIRSTMISDNHQGWFQTQPLNGKKHPRFSYCVEQSSGMLSAIWYVITNTIASMWPIILLLGTVYNTIAAIIIAIEAAVNAIRSIFGQPDVDWGIDIIKWDNITDFYRAIMAESAGCGREHPAPLIRDYIQNVCTKCGLTVNAETAPIFFAPVTEFKTSDPTAGNNGVITKENPHFNACYFFPQVKRGIRRYNKWNIFDGPTLNTTDYLIWDNRPVLTLDMFLNQLCTVYNARWTVQGGKLYFNRKDWFIQNNYLFDFTKNSPDRSKIVEGVCFETTDRKYPAYSIGLWGTDASDRAGSEAGGDNGTGQTNGMVTYGNLDNNPNYEGVDDKTTLFGPATFRFDGVRGDYIYDAGQNVFNAGITSFIIPGSSLVYVNAVTITLKEIDNFSKYAVLMSAENCAKPKIIIWDGDSYTSARALISHKAAPYDGGLESEPTPNTRYNTSNKAWMVDHYPDTKVSGSRFVFNSQQAFFYEVRRTNGQSIVKHAAMLVNYPMYFEPNFRGTMWDYFHWIDDPTRNLRLNMKWSVKLELCCPDLFAIKPFGNSHDIVLGQRCKIEHGFFQDGIIREIDISYDPDDEFGRYIQISGDL
jgi:hypothetical protein